MDFSEIKDLTSINVPKIIKKSIKHNTKAKGVFIMDKNYNLVNK